MANQLLTSSWRQQKASMLIQRSVFALRIPLQGMCYLLLSLSHTHTHTHHTSAMCFLFSSLFLFLFLGLWLTIHLSHHTSAMCFLFSSLSLSLSRLMANHTSLSLLHHNTESLLALLSHHLSSPLSLSLSTTHTLYLSKRWFLCADVKQERTQVAWWWLCPTPSCPTADTREPTSSSPLSTTSSRNSSDCLLSAQNSTKFIYLMFGKSSLQGLLSSLSHIYEQTKSDFVEYW